MLDGQDLDYEAAVHLDLPFDEGFYPDWDGTDLADDLHERRVEAELDADDPSRIFNALCDAGIM